MKRYQKSFYHSRMGICLDKPRLVLLGLRPVGGIVSMFAGRIGQTDANLCTLILQERCGDTVGDSITVGQADGGDVDLLTIGSVNDMFLEKSRDSMEWREEASQGDMDKF